MYFPLHYFNVVCIIFLILGGQSVRAQEKRLVCYWASWSQYRTGLGQFTPANMDPFLCTHIIYAFAGLDPNTNTIRVLDPWNDLSDGEPGGHYGNFRNVIALKNTNPNLKVLIGVGGWNEGSINYSNMVSSSANRQTFIQSVVNLISTYGFDGMELDWEYPTQRGGVPSDRTSFTDLMKEFRAAFDAMANKPLATIAIAAAKSKIDACYDIVELSKYVSFFNVMAYDYYTWSSSTTVQHHSPLHARPTETGEAAEFNVEFSINYLLQVGAPPELLNLGIPAYGQSFTLGVPGQNAIGSPSSGPGSAGQYSQAPGTYTYYEVCDKINNNGWVVERDPDSQAPHAYSQTEWVGYDDTESVRNKVDFLKSKGLGGAMVWSYDYDACTIQCGSEPPCSLLQNIKQELNN